jgi:hypothetical protein
MATRCYIFAVVTTMVIWMMRRRIYVGKNNVHTVHSLSKNLLDLLCECFWCLWPAALWWNEALPPNLFCLTCDFLDAHRIYFAICFSFILELYLSCWCRWVYWYVPCSPFDVWRCHCTHDDMAWLWKSHINAYETRDPAAGNGLLQPNVMCMPAKNPAIIFHFDLLCCHFTDLRHHS